MELISKLFSVSGLLVDFVAFIIGGQGWFYSLVHGVRSAFRWNKERVLRQSARRQQRVTVLTKKFADKPGLINAMRLQYHAAGTRVLAWQVDDQNARDRRIWNLEPRSVLNFHGELQREIVELNSLELDIAIAEQTKRQKPRDFGSLSFKLFCFGTVLTLVGTVL